MLVALLNECEKIDEITFITDRWPKKAVEIGKLGVEGNSVSIRNNEAYYYIVTFLVFFCSNILGEERCDLEYNKHPLFSRLFV